MRIVAANWSSRNFGGTEAYLDTIMPMLASAGCGTALLSDVDTPGERPRIRLAGESPRWCVAEFGLSLSLEALRRWNPDVIYVHEVMQPELEAELFKIAPAVLFAHSYHGTCISGEKLNKLPVPMPCSRRFGWQCLFHYFPRRCGGLSPLTMLRLYGEQSERCRVLRSYRMILTASDHMRAEYLRQGLAPQSVRTIHLPVEPAHEDHLGNGKSSVLSWPEAGAEPGRPWRLLFVGRMTAVKGGLKLLDSLPQICGKLQRPLRVTFVGDGSERAQWEAAARRVRAENNAIEVSFTGWVDRSRLIEHFSASDLLVIPSLWPEPFGLVGPEAGLHAVPAAGFAVGGIPEWLIDGVNGHLAPGDPPTAAGLAGAIVKCLCDPADHNRLRRGALDVARRFNVAEHMRALLEVFAEVTAAPTGRAVPASPLLN